MKLFMASSAHLLLFLNACLLLLPLLPTSGQRSTYIIHMNSSSMPASQPTHHDWYSTILENMSLATPNSTTSGRPQLLHTYHHALTGFAATLTADELRAMEGSSGFIAAYPDLEIKLHTTRTPQFLCLNHDTGLWPSSSYGDGVVIGVIDSGVWSESPSLNDGGMSPAPLWWNGTCELGTRCNWKLIGARSFNVSSSTADGESARDNDGHGTLVASVAAGAPVSGASFFGYANGTAVGMAPRAWISVYEVADGRTLVAFTCNVLAAMDAAIADRVDVISIAMGLTDLVPLYEDPFAIASFSAMKKGIMVVFSAGNDGPSNYTVTNAFPWAITVGGSSVDRRLTGTLTVYGDSFTGVSLYPLSKLLVDLPLVYNATISHCNSSELISQAAAGKIVVCHGLGGIGSMFYQIAAVNASEAAAAVFVTDDALFLEDGEFACPAIALDLDTGEVLLRYLSSLPYPTASMEFQETQVSGFLGPVIAAPAIGTYSSRGPSLISPDVLKPDVVAPGTRILGAWPTNKPAATAGAMSLANPFAVKSGTSFASAHVAGIAALLQAANYHSWSPAAIRSAMMTTAHQLDNTGDPIKDSATNSEATPLAIGAGHVDPNRALHPGLVYDAGEVDYVSFLCSQGFSQEQIMAIVGVDSYDCSSPSPHLNYPSFIAFFPPQPLWPGPQSFMRTVTNVDTKPAVYRAFVRQPVGFTVSVQPEELVFNATMATNTANFVLTIVQNEEPVTVVSSGSLTWVHEEFTYTVRSPIVVVAERAPAFP
nr:PREDICTED: subtilisin-like protease SBT1.9 [Musa acuminata subsp. malaccensis]